MQNLHTTRHAIFLDGLDGSDLTSKSWWLVVSFMQCHQNPGVNIPVRIRVATTKSNPFLAGAQWFPKNIVGDSFR